MLFYIGLSGAAMQFLVSLAPDAFVILTAGPFS